MVDRFRNLSVGFRTIPLHHLVGFRLSQDESIEAGPMCMAEFLGPRLTAHAKCSQVRFDSLGFLNNSAFKKGIDSGDSYCNLIKGRAQYFRS